MKCILDLNLLLETCRLSPKLMNNFNQTLLSIKMIKKFLFTLWALLNHYNKFFFLVAFIVYIYLYLLFRPVLCFELYCIYCNYIFYLQNKKTEDCETNIFPPTTSTQFILYLELFELFVLLDLVKSLIRFIRFCTLICQ